MPTRRIALFTLLVSVLPLGCKEKPIDEIVAETGDLPGNAVRASCARVRPARQKPIDVSGAGAAVVLARAGAQRVAFVADEEDAAVHTIDIDSQAEIAVTPVDGAPVSLLVLADGRLAVSLRDRDHVEVLEPKRSLDQPLEKLCSVGVATEPAGLALSPDGATMFVASRWGHALTALSTEDLTPRFQVDLPRDPYAVIASSDGAKVFVSHVAGSKISVVDSNGEHAIRSIDLHDKQQVRHVIGLSMDGDRNFSEGSGRLEKRDQRADQGYALVRTMTGNVLAPEAMVDTGNGVRSSGYGEGRSAFGDVAAISESTEKRLIRPAFGGKSGDCLLPRGAAIDVDDNKLVVACFGLDAIVTYDAKSPAPHTRELDRYSVGGGPTGVAVDDSHRAIVWSSFTRRLSIIDLRRRIGNTTQTIMLDQKSNSMSLAATNGRALFYATGNTRVAFDGRACASCHPDGRDDALTWTTPEGPRQTPMLASRLEGTAPYGWSGASRDLREHMRHTIDRLAGKGLDDKQQEELFAYIATLKTPATPKPAAKGPMLAVSLQVSSEPTDPHVARGDALFHSEGAGCSSCHLGDDLTDGMRHDVKSRAIGDGTNAFDTPSLRFVGKSAPYYHDGRYATLGDLLRATDGKMGHTKQLSNDEREDLVAYLQSLE